MSVPKLHLVGGFLGSGKTTAIINACKLLAEQGLRAGVVTNDQGKYLVDTAFIRLENIPAVEVSGGCFCCSYSDFEQQLDAIIRAAQPDVIFAESVGSCADLVATVIRPLAEFQISPLRPNSLSVFTDARLLRLYLSGEGLPFSEHVVYIFEQQIKESQLCVINKKDLISEEEQQELAAAFRGCWPEKETLFQTSLSSEGVRGWLDHLGKGPAVPAWQTLHMDYQRYGSGEQKLSWFDAEILLFSDNDGRRAAISLLRSIQQRLRSANCTIGHLKFVLSPPSGKAVKVSFTSIGENNWERNLLPLGGPHLRLLINARVEMPAQELDELFSSAFEEVGRQMEIQILDRQCFHPKPPLPTHRLTGGSY